MDSTRTSALLTGLSADAPRARLSSRVATLTQNAAIAHGVAIVAGMRGVMKAAHPSAEIRRAYGVGAKGTATTVKAARAAAEQILARATANSAEARAAGIHETDITALRDALGAIVGADSAQENTRAAAPATTRARNEAARRLEDAVRRISAAGQLHFVGDAARRAAYGALTSKSAAKVKVKGDAPPVA